ncbi:hypothetical protein HPK19_07550 [Arthrobacter citreus]|nr:hypothetical protein HPK19_07550 [Arthrobacter citreus]
MFINVHCNQCIDISYREDKPLNFRFYKANVNENGIYNFTCDNGHKITAISVYDKYEILFQMGANALLDGYYFEAVGCFIASVERFREWVIKFIWYLNGIDEKACDNQWKQMKRYSERQTGAFYALFLNQFNEIAPNFDDNKNGFRNDVMHNGTIPTEDKTYEFGEYIFNYIRSIQKTIYLKYKQETFAFSSRELNSKISKNNLSGIPRNELVLQSSADMILLLPYAEMRNSTFDEELSHFKTYKEHPAWS